MKLQIFNHASNKTLLPTRKYNSLTAGFLS